jgi:hypothetical protein
MPYSGTLFSACRLNHSFRCKFWREREVVRVTVGVEGVEGVPIGLGKRQTFLNSPRLNSPRQIRIGDEVTPERYCISHTLLNGILSSGWFKAASRNDLAFEDIPQIFLSYSEAIGPWFS